MLKKLLIIKAGRCVSRVLNSLLVLAVCGAFYSCMEDNSPSIVGGKETGGEPITGGGPDEGTDTYSHIFKKGSEGYSCFRIPAIIQSKKGTLLAFAEARKNSCSDTGDIDLVLRRSSDDGSTWSDMIMVWDDGVNTCGNPAPVIDEETGTIFLLMTWNNGADGISEINAGTGVDTRRVYICQSTDDGLTWSTPTEITATTKLSTWGWYATGPCHGIQLKKGANKGRLVVPCDYIALKSAGGGGGAHVIYSDDKGVTWQLGGYTNRGNESTVAELSDGRLLLNIRISNNNNNRVISISDDAGLSWTAPVNAPLIDPVCQGSMVSGALADGSWAVFFSNPASVERKNMVVKMSLDNGTSWAKHYTVYEGAAGYSDLVFLSDTYLGLLYEAGAANYNDGIAYRKIAISKF